MKRPDKQASAYDQIGSPNYQKERAELIAILKAGDHEAWQKKISEIDYPKLAEADLQGLELFNFTLDFADLRCANLSKANLSGASFVEADLRGAQLKEAYGRQASFDGSDMLEVRMENSNFTLASFKKVKLPSAVMTGSILRSSNFLGANLSWTKMDDCDLDDAKGLEFSSTLIRNSRISQQSSDLWSTLRKNYTGFRFGLNLAIVAIFFIPYIAKAVFWSAIATAQSTDLIATGTEKICQHAECMELSVLSLILGIAEPALNSALVIALIVYTLLRFAMTMHIASLREHEDRTGFTPPIRVPHPTVPASTMPLDIKQSALNAYGWLAWPHRAVSLMQWVAGLSILYHAAYWMQQVVTVPVG